MEKEGSPPPYLNKKKESVLKNSRARMGTRTKLTNIKKSRTGYKNDPI